MNHRCLVATCIAEEVLDLFICPLGLGERDTVSEIYWKVLPGGTVMSGDRRTRQEEKPGRCECTQASGEDQPPDAQETAL